MKVLLIGSGGREHALAWKISRSPLLERLYAAPGSDAIAAHAELARVSPADHAAVSAFCAKKGIDLVVVGPEVPLADGLADSLRAAGAAVFGPGRKAARLEASKSFAKEFMRRHGIPSARSESFNGLAAAKAALSSFGLPVVVKADGLAAGKGVTVAADRRAAEAALQECLEGGSLGTAGRTVLLEEFLGGRETTLLGLCDGKTFLELPPSTDHKRLLDGDAGPNTGGMGVLAPTPEVTGPVLARIRTEIVDRVLAGLAADSLPYRGALYCGLMLTASGPKVLEFNVRFGDPETQAVLPLLDSDLLPFLKAAADGRLPASPLAWSGAAVTVVLASQGYPAKPVSGRRIAGLDAASAEDGVLVFHAGTRRDGDAWLTAGGRVLALTARAATAAEARERAYRAARLVRFEGMQYRKDIGTSLRPLRAAEVS